MILRRYWRSPLHLFSPLWAEMFLSVSNNGEIFHWVAILRMVTAAPLNHKSFCFEHGSWSLRYQLSNDSDLSFAFACHKLHREHCAAPPIRETNDRERARQHSHEGMFLDYDGIPRQRRPSLRVPRQKMKLSHRCPWTGVWLEENKIWFRTWLPVTRNSQWKKGGYGFLPGNMKFGSISIWNGKLQRGLPASFCY